MGGLAALGAGAVACGGGAEAARATAPVAECPSGTAAGASGPRAMRGMWLTTFDNVDWPRKPGLPAATQQADLVKLLDMAASMNLNTVFLQVRPRGDAIYPTAYAPWSQYLTGTQGKDPGYDPLEFAITQAHARGLSVQAWFDPFWAGAVGDHLAAGNPARDHPSWVRHFDGWLWLDPGLPQVRDLVVETIIDVVHRYDVDGVHMDDFFYPYPVAGKTFPDAGTYAAYGKGASPADWRRANIDAFVRQVYGRVHAEKPWVTFGISPFGVWRNASSDPAGSDTHALESYSATYSDSRGWVRDGWVDYIVPQLYWSIGFADADYAVLVPWWSRQVTGTGVQLYIGQAAYEVGAGGAWDDPAELPRHLALDARFPRVQGELFYSAASLAANSLGVAGRIHSQYFATPILAPVPAGRRDTAALVPPRALRAGAAAGRVNLTWTGGAAHRYAVYRLPGASGACLTPPAARLLAVLDGTTTRYADTTVATGAQYTYYVTALDRLSTESSPARAAIIRTAHG